MSGNADAARKPVLRKIGKQPSYVKKKPKPKEEPEWQKKGLRKIERGKAQMTSEMEKVKLKGVQRDVKGTAKTKIDFSLKSTLRDKGENVDDLNIRSFTDKDKTEVEIVEEVTQIKEETEVEVGEVGEKVVQEEEEKEAEEAEERRRRKVEEIEETLVGEIEEDEEEEEETEETGVEEIEKEEETEETVVEEEEKEEETEETVVTEEEGKEEETEETVVEEEEEKSETEEEWNAEEDEKEEEKVEETVEAEEEVEEDVAEEVEEYVAEEVVVADGENHQQEPQGDESHEEEEENTYNIEHDEDADLLDGSYSPLKAPEKDYVNKRYNFHARQARRHRLRRWQVVMGEQSTTKDLFVAMEVTTERIRLRQERRMLKFMH